MKGAAGKLADYVHEWLVRRMASMVSLQLTARCRHHMHWWMTCVRTFARLCGATDGHPN